MFSSPGGAPSDWVQWDPAVGGNGHYYRAVAAPAGIDWGNASAQAVAAGGYLATLTSNEENEFVFGLVNDDGFWSPAPENHWSFGPWIGGIQPAGSVEPEGGWTWGTGEPFVFTAWYPAQPNEDDVTGANQNRVHFAHPYHPSRGPTWNDLSEHRLLPSYVIESDSPPQANPCFLLDFETEDDFTTPLVNGQHIDTEFGELVCITSEGSHAGVGIFDSTMGGPNDPSQDPDLLVNTGNLLILQTENFPADGDDVFPVPNDDRDGGTLSFAFDVEREAVSVRLVDVDSSDGSWSVELTDASGRRRTYLVPTNWTGDATGGAPGQGILDLSTLAPQVGFAAIATAYEDPGFEADRMVRLEIDVGGSGAIDDLRLCTKALPRADVVTRNGSGVNPMALVASSPPALGGRFRAVVDCSAAGPGIAILEVRLRPTDGMMAPGGEILISGPLVSRSVQLHLGSTSVFTWDVPASLALLGTELHAQGLVRGLWLRTGASQMRSVRRLTNALDLVLGY